LSLSVESNQSAEQGVILGYSAATFDKRDHPLEDLTTRAGFHKALGLVVRLRFAGMCWAAPVCSSWVWVGRYQTERTSNNPASNKINMSVNMANRMVFTCLLLLVAFARGAYIYVEQPLSSLMPQFPVAWITVERIPTYLGSFGCDTQKPIIVLTNNDQAMSLKRARKAGKSQLVFKNASGSMTGKLVS
jgi:hypothetical protein